CPGPPGGAGAAAAPAAPPAGRPGGRGALAPGAAPSGGHPPPRPRGPSPPRPALCRAIAPPAPVRCGRLPRAPAGSLTSKAARSGVRPGGAPPTWRTFARFFTREEEGRAGGPGTLRDRGEDHSG